MYVTTEGNLSFNCPIKPFVHWFWFVAARNYCHGHKCLNGATCQNGKNNYTCQCVMGSSGMYCETGQYSYNACVAQYVMYEVYHIAKIMKKSFYFWNMFIIFIVVNWLMEILNIYIKLSYRIEHVFLEHLKNDENDTSTNCNYLFNFPNTPQSK